MLGNSKNIFFTEHLWATTSVSTLLNCLPNPPYFQNWEKRSKEINKFCKKHSARSDKNLCASLFFLKLPVCNFRSSHPDVFWKKFFIKNSTLAQVFLCEFCESFKSTFLQRTPLVAASVTCNFTTTVPHHGCFCQNFTTFPQKVFSSAIINGCVRSFFSLFYFVPREILHDKESVQINLVKPPLQ